MESRIIGTLEVSAIGLGCMNMSGGYGRGDDVTSSRLLHMALDLGYQFLDTATMYGGGHNETLIGNTLKKRRNEYVLASKCGLFRDNHGNKAIDGRPETIRRQCEASLKRLQTDVIDLYYLHRLDKNVPVEESVGELGRLAEEGKIREIGLSEVSSDTLTRANKVHRIGAVQSEYSLWSRTPETKMLATCEALGIAFVPFSPLGRQFLTGKAQDLTHFSQNDIRRTNASPRFEPKAFAENSKLLKPFGEITQELKCTMAQLAIAWLLEQKNSTGNKSLIPIPGTKHIEYMKENAGAASIRLSEDVLEKLNALINEQTVIGTRYNADLMASIDSEKDRH
ncbi:aldo/keto reductase [Parasalinivibrio latis]|uniref:aldo/keto reductase n=1 Tax=Parasalinivibrio latis TaxID=2952610 RepID=UPI0030E11E3D